MATLTSTITEEITINGVERGATRSVSIAGVNDTFNRIVTCPAGADTSIVTFQTAVNTSTGAIDPIDAMADVCAEMNAWLHVDGAYGYAYKLVPEWAHRFLGDNRADSIVWDPHKQLGAPIPNSVLFMKDRREFIRMALHSSYFNRPEDVEPNPGIKSPPSTRPMSALPLVTILRGQGIEQIVQDLRSPLAAIQALAESLDAQPDVEVMHQPDLGVLCFRLTPEGIPTQESDALQRSLYEQVMSSGKRSISITQLDGVTALRLVIVSPHTTYKDLWESIEELRNLASKTNY